MEIQRSPREVSIGIVTSSWPGSGDEETGTVSTARCQPGIAFTAGWPTTLLASIAVIASAAGFQSRIVPLRSSNRIAAAPAGGGRIRARLDLADEPRAVEGEADPDGEVLDEGEVVGAEGIAADGP